MDAILSLCRDSAAAPWTGSVMCRYCLMHFFLHPVLLSAAMEAILRVNRYLRTTSYTNTADSRVFRHIDRTVFQENRFFFLFLATEKKIRNKSDDTKQKYGSRPGSTCPHRHITFSAVIGLMSDDSIIQMIRQALPDHILDSYGSVEIVGAETGNRAGLLGAAALAMEAVAQA